MQDSVPGLTLVAVYLQGSIPRGVALPGLSDVDTVGFATISTDLPESDVYIHPGNPLYASAIEGRRNMEK